MGAQNEWKLAKRKDRKENTKMQTSGKTAKVKTGMNSAKVIANPTES